MYKNIPKDISFVNKEKLSKYITYSNSSIKDAMNKLNLTIELFQIILDQEGKFLGTLTDGDIRRGLLAGSEINDNVMKFINCKPLLGEISKESENLNILNKVDRYPMFLPIIDKKFLLEGILIKTENTDINHALIVAGGIGSRLGGLTKDIPKPMLEVDGRPILEHCINKLEDANISTIYISVNYLSEQIINFIKSKNFKSNIIPVKENSKLGTIGSLFLIKEETDYPLLVMNADLVTTLSLSALMSFYRAENVDGLITAATFESSIPFGVLKYNSLGQLERIEEKPISKNLIAAGVYILNKNISSLIKKEEFIDMPQLLDKAIKNGLNIGVFPIHEKWTDIGRPEDYFNIK